MDQNMLSMEFLKQITNDFSEKIGTGLFGVVYKGTFPDGLEVAVKEIDPSAGSKKDFSKEVEILHTVKHKNIVKLLGYCNTQGVDGRPRKFLCLEYAPNGSLDRHIYGEPSNTLEWPLRFRIIKGICMGLQVLHVRENPIVHADLNPGNILLDKDMEPKIADFGLSWLFGVAQTHTQKRNTKSAIEYMAPEYLRRASLTIKSDVYSLGLLILVIVTSEEICTDAESFIEDVRENWTDKYTESKYGSAGAEALRQVKGCIRIGLRCVEIQRDKRPSSREVIDMVNKSGEKTFFGKLKLIG